MENPDFTTAITVDQSPEEVYRAACNRARGGAMILRVTPIS